MLTPAGQPLAVPIAMQSVEQHVLRPGAPHAKKKAYINADLFFSSYGAPGMIRTCDPLVRSQVLYPAELRALKEGRII